MCATVAPFHCFVNFSDIVGEIFIVLSDMSDLFLLFPVFGNDAEGREAVIGGGMLVSIHWSQMMVYDLIGRLS